MKQEKFDFVVCGAGLAGMIAAVSAARRGLKTALLNDRSVPGGNSSSEIGVGIAGASRKGQNPSVYARETGLVDEIRLNLDYATGYCGYGDAAARDAVFLDLLYNEPNLTLYLNTVVTDATVKDGKITSVIAYRMRQDEKIEFVAPVYADCTGDSVVAHKAGADTAMGAETDASTMGCTLFFEIEDVGHPVKFVRPAFAHDVAKMDFMKDIKNPEKRRMLHVGGRFWMLEYGGHINTISDSEHITLELRKLVFGLWDHIKNSGEFPNAENFVIKRVHSLAGSRESRRILGDYILTETDIDQGVHFADSVATGGYNMGTHAPKGIYDDLPAAEVIPVPSCFDIPYRCLYSRNVDNLFMAGRNISATHLALSATRITATCGVVGQAVGTAAWLCKKYDFTPRDVYNNAIPELQQALLEDDQYIIGRRETGCEELEKQFAVTADSTCDYENLPDSEIERPLTHCLGLVLPIKTEKLDGVSIKVKNLTDQPQTLKIRILAGSKAEAYLPERILSELELPVEANYCGWLPIAVGQPHGGDSKVYLALLENENLAVYGTANHLPGALTCKYYTAKTDGFSRFTCPLNSDTGFIGQDNLYTSFNLCFKDVLPRQNIFTPDNLLNGFTRPYGHANLWLSEKQETANVVLTAQQPQYVRRIEIYFNNELENDRRNVIPAATVKDYNLCLTTDGGQEVIEIRDNFQRKSVVEINKNVSQIKLELLSTYGDRQYGIYGIKLY